MGKLEELLGIEKKEQQETMKGAQKMSKKYKMTIGKDGKPRFTERAYIYGQLFRGYVESDLADKYTIENINVRKDTWKKYLFGLVKNGYIRSFRLGNTIETACQLTIYGFNGEKLLYEEYCQGIIKNMKEEKNKVSA